MKNRDIENINEILFLITNNLYNYKVSFDKDNFQIDILAGKKGVIRISIILKYSNAFSKYLIIGKETFKFERFDGFKNKLSEILRGKQ